MTSFIIIIAAISLGYLIGKKHGRDEERKNHTEEYECYDIPNFSQYEKTEPVLETYDKATLIINGKEQEICDVALSKNSHNMHLEFSTTDVDFQKYLERKIKRVYKINTLKKDYVFDAQLKCGKKSYILHNCTTANCQADYRYDGVENVKLIFDWYQANEGLS